MNTIANSETPTTRPRSGMREPSQPRPAPQAAAAPSAAREQRGLDTPVAIALSPTTAGGCDAEHRIRRSWQGLLQDGRREGGKAGSPKEETGSSLQASHDANSNAKP